MFIELNIIRPLKRYLHILQSIVSSQKYNNPAKDLKLIGVTGTSGKSTTSHMIYHLLHEFGFKVGLISTVEAIVGEEKIETGLHVTSPDPDHLQSILAKMRNEGIKYVIVEASSHALAQGRSGLLKFDFSVFTNINRDHLDWHLTWKNYAESKAILIDKNRDGEVIINKDDSESFEFLSTYLNKSERKNRGFIGYSISSEVSDVKESTLGLNFLYKTSRVEIPILGKFNIENALAAIKVAELLGISNEEIIRELKTFKGVKGRMELIKGQPFSVIVDFAHNSDSLLKSLKSTKELIQAGGRLITVFGSAGLRDIEKRSTMGKISGEIADIIIITAEDPRTEDLIEINSQIIRGAESSGAKLEKRFKDHNEYLEFREQKLDKIRLGKDIKGLIYVFDEQSTQGRFDAIDFAINVARDGDIVITEGKGHEKSLCFGTTEYPFTDYDAINKSLCGRI